MNDTINPFITKPTIGKVTRRIGGYVLQYSDPQQGKVVVPTAAAMFDYIRKEHADSSIEWDVVTLQP